MLDKRTSSLISKLDKLCDNGAYKVFDLNELATTLKSKEDALKSDLNYLKDYGYIDIKYSDESVVCLAVLPKARAEKENLEDKAFTSKSIVRIMFFTCILSALFSFLGAFIATLITK